MPTEIQEFPEIEEFPESEGQAPKPIVAPTETIGPSTLSTSQKLRISPVGRFLLGPTEIERQGMVGETPAEQRGVLELGETLLGATAPGATPWIEKPAMALVRSATPLPFLPAAAKAVGAGPTIERLAAIPSGAVQGMAAAVLGFPLAPIPGMKTKAGVAALATFGAEYLANQPEQLAAFKAAINQGDYGEASKIAIGDVATGAALGLGAREARRTQLENRIKQAEALPPARVIEPPPMALSEPPPIPRVSPPPGVTVAEPVVEAKPVPETTPPEPSPKPAEPAPAPASGGTATGAVGAVGAGVAPAGKPVTAVPPRVLPQYGISSKDIAKQYGMPEDFYGTADETGQVSSKYRTAEYDAAVEAEKRVAKLQGINATTIRGQARQRTEKAFRELVDKARISSAQGTASAAELGAKQPPPPQGLKTERQGEEGQPPLETPTKPAESPQGTPAETPPSTAAPVPAGRDWEVFNEQLYDELDAWNPARSSGRISYELNDVADRFVEFAKADKSGKPLDELVREFAKGDEASAGQITKLRKSVKSILAAEKPEPPPPVTGEAPLRPAAPVPAAPEGSAEGVVPATPSQPAIEPSISQPKGKGKATPVAPKVGEPFARIGDYEFALIKGHIPERPDMYGVGVRRVGSTMPFESGGYGANIKKDAMLERWAEKEVASGSMEQEQEFRHSAAESAWKSEVERQDKVRAEKEAKERAEREANAAKQKAWNEYKAAVEATPLPKGKKGVIQVGGQKGEQISLTGTAYGDWFIDKTPSKYDKTPYNVTHIPSGFRVSGDGFSTASEAKQYVQALIHSKVPTRWTQKHQILDADLAKLRQVGKAWLADGDVPDYFNPTPEAKPQVEAGLGAEQGMGGAVPAEFGQKGDFVSNMFAVIDKDRAEMGKPPMDPTVRRTWDEANQKALSMMNRDPNWIPDLLDRMEKNPRPLSQEENAGVVWHRAKLKAEYNNALQRVARAFDDNRTEDLDAAKVDAAMFEDRLDRLDSIVGRNGTGSEAGRSLQALKMGSGDDFTLVEMTLRKRAAVGGRKLTPEETSALQKQVEQLNTLNAALQKSLADADARASKAAADLAMAELKAQSAPGFDKRILAHAEAIVRKMEEAAKPAATRLRERLMRMSAGVDPTIVYDAAIVGSAKIARLGLDLAKFTDEMVRDFSEKIRPMIPEIWAASNKMLDEIKAPPAVKRAIQKTDLVELKKATVENVKDKIVKKQTDKITWEVQNLARAFVKSGITDREALIDAVHDVIKDAIPGQTRRQTMDMISGYGDFKRLSRDQITVQLRGMKGEMQQLAKLEDMAKGKPPLKTGLERRTPTQAERKLIKAVNDAKNKFQVPITDPETQLKSSLDTLKTTLANRIKDYEDRLARKDYAPRPRREVVMDARANELRVQSERIKKRFRDELVADRLKNRFGWEKTMDWATKYRRAGVLSSPIVIPKLISAGLQRLGSLPLEEGAGEAYSRLPGYRAVSAKAPLEGGGMNLNAEMRGYGAAFTQGLKDAYQVLKTGHSDLDVLYGKSGESYTGEFEMASKLLAFPGRLHGMIKAPIKRATFERAVQRYGDWYARQGLNPADPVVMTRIAVDSYKAANRSIFLNDNFVASKVQSWLSEHRPKGETHPTFGSKVWSTAGRVALPITRVPINIVAETMQYAGGLVSGNIRLAAALRKGVDTLKPEQADLIMRELKKGSIGAAVMALGYFNANAIGGYYQPGKKQKPREQKYGTIRVYGTDIPSYLLHNPLLETLQVGATVRHVAESHLRKKDTTPEGLGWGVYAAGLGMVEQVPFMREMAEIEKARNPYMRGSFVGEQAKSILVPSAVQKIAEWTDTAEKRKPRTVTEHLKTGIPGLRQQVPTK